MSGNFEVINIVHSNPNFKQYSEAIYWENDNISIFGSLVAGLLEVIIRKKLSSDLSGQVYVQFSKALRLKTKYSSNEYFSEAYPLLESLLELFENSKNTLSDLNDWLWCYLLSGEYCINEKIIYVFKNILLALVQNEKLRYKIESHEMLTKDEVYLLVQEICEYFKVCINIVDKRKTNILKPKNANGFYPLIVIEDIKEQNYILLKANLYEKNGMFLNDYGFLCVKNTNYGHSSVNYNSKNNSQYTKNSSESLNLESESGEIEREEKFIKARSKSIEKLLSGFEYKSKSTIKMSPIQRSNRIKIIEGTHPDVTLGISRAAAFEKSKIMCDSGMIEDFQMIKNVVKYYYKNDSNFGNLPVEIIKNINQMGCKKKLVEQFPSLRQLINLEETYNCQICRMLKDPDDYQLFICKSKCIVCFNCRKMHSTTRCHLCGREYSDYEKDLFNTLR